MEKATLLYEIGTEEIPAEPLYNAMVALKPALETALNDARLEFSEVTVFATPRRIAIQVKELASESTALTQRIKGPAVASAYDENGNPTRALEGFARSKGVDINTLERGEESGREFVYAVVSKAAQTIEALLPDMLLNLTRNIHWPRSQRWGSGDEHFSRPVRWLVCLWGTKVIPVSFAGLQTSNVTYGHRFLAPEPIELKDAEAYLPAMANAYVVVSRDDRVKAIREGIAQVETELNKTARVPENIFNEVVNLVEYPTVLVGRFEEKFLQVPSEIITDALLKHQRYFPLYEKDGSLSREFILVSNGNRACNETIIEGNERVVRARLADAEFFYHEDLKKKLEEYVPALDKVVFREELGSMGDKVRRVVELVGTLAEASCLDEQTATDAKRAALLAKADLVSQVVVEFTTLQGIMGGKYAISSGENEAVATAVAQHYAPRFAGDALPSNTAGKYVALCDKLDTLCGIFAIGQGPTGSSDPFAVRRSAIGIINILLSGVNVNLSQAIKASLDEYKRTIEFDYDAVFETCRTFFAGRLDVIAKDRAFAPDEIAAVSALGIVEPNDYFARLQALSSARKNQPELFVDLATAYARANNLRKADLGLEVAEANLVTEEERAFVSAIEKAKVELASALAQANYPQALEALAALREPIDAFFDAVLIMDKDEAIRENRLKLLNKFVSLFDNVVDLGKLAG